MNFLKPLCADLFNYLWSAFGWQFRFTASFCLSFPKIDFDEEDTWNFEANLTILRFVVLDFFPKYIKLLIPIDFINREIWESSKLFSESGLHSINSFIASKCSSWLNDTLRVSQWVPLTSVTIRTIKSITRQSVQQFFHLQHSNWPP